MIPKRRGGREGLPTAVVLAAGTSSRFGGPKLLSKIGGKTLLERVLDAVPKAQVLETVVVLGRGAAKSRAVVVPREGVRTVTNGDYRSGVGSSIRAGISALGSGTAGALLLLADQPFVTRRLLSALLKDFERGGSRFIVATSYGSVVAPPVIFPRRCFLELSRLRGDRGARSVILRNIEDVSLFKVKGRFYLTDIDTVDDLHEAEGLFEHREARE